MGSFLMICGKKGNEDMNRSILEENRIKGQEKPLWMLVCFAMFCFWQMGFVYFLGPALNIDGRTPLPISMDNVATLIAVCYVLSILWMIFLPHTVIWTQRVVTAVALLTAVGMFLPLEPDLLEMLIYTQVFCCCLMIGFETFIMVNFFSERSNIHHLTLAYGIAIFLIALVQNDLFPISYAGFRIATVGALILLLIFFLKMPGGREPVPRYVKKSDGLTAPKRLLFGTYATVFVGALMGVSGPSISGEIKHGVCITYLTDGLVSMLLYILYRKRNVHPFRLMPWAMAVGGLGFLLMLGGAYVPALSYVSSAMIGVGLVSCQLIPLYGSVVMKSYPSKYIPPVIIGLALVAVLIQSSMVELFRSVPAMLYLTYGLIMVSLVIFYTQIEPFFLFHLRKRWREEEPAGAGEKQELPQTVPASRKEDCLASLSAKEREVAELICMGHSNRDIARLLYISEHTVKTHTKNIYPKLGVHSRLELAALVSGERVRGK